MHGKTGKVYRNLPGDKVVVTAVVDVVVGVVLVGVVVVGVVVVGVVVVGVVVVGVVVVGTVCVVVWNVTKLINENYPSLINVYMRKRN